MVTCFLALGSNQDDPLKQLKSGLKSLASTKAIRLIRYSSFYRSKPVDDSKQPDFINLVAKIETNLNAEALLSSCQAIEKAHKRERHSHWGPRTLDIDIILYGNEAITSEKLTIPHREMHKRDFVLVPLLELAPKQCLPCGKSIKTLLPSAKTVIIQQISFPNDQPIALT